MAQVNSLTFSKFVKETALHCGSQISRMCLAEHNRFIRGRLLKTSSKRLQCSVVKYLH